jgi:Alternative complex III, ActD subunit
MEEPTTLLALFKDIDPSAEAIEQLRKMGIKDDQIEVISGIPILGSALGRPKKHTNVGRLALGGAGLGILLGLFLNYGTPYLFKLHVGGQPLYPFPPGIILVFEMGMLGLMGSAFLGVFLESRFPAYRPAKYLPEISDGKIAVLFECPAAEQDKFIQVMQALGAESIGPAEARRL